MTNVKDFRNEFLLGISLSEISFIFFMLMVLISLHSIDQLKKDIESTTRELAETKKELVTQEVLKDTKKLFIENKKELKKVKKKRDFYKEAGEKQAKVIQDDKKYIKSLLSNLGLSKSEIEEFQTKLVNVRKLKQKIYVLKKEKDQIKKDQKEYKLTDLNINEIFKQFSEIRNKLKSAGLDGAQLRKMIKENDKSGGKWHDLPPCFFTYRKATIEKSNKKEDFMYKIDVFEKEFILTPIWLDKDQKEMEKIWRNISKNKDLDKKSSAFSRDKFMLKIDEFTTFGSIIREDADLNNCHHHVLINDETGDSKEVWKRNLDTIEDYFYKFICTSGC